jgi:hypothetical protein
MTADGPGPDDPGADAPSTDATGEGADGPGAPSDPRHGGWTLATVAYLVGLLGFVGSALAFVAVLVLGGDVELALAGNAASTGVLVAWAAYDSLTDPDSTVATLPGAVGTAMVLVAVYGVLAAAVVAITSPRHGRLDLAWLFAGGAVVAGVLAAVTFPLEVVAGDGPGEPEPAAEEPEPAAGEPEPAAEEDR